MPNGLIRAFSILKKAAALTNQELGILPAEKAKLISDACESFTDNCVYGIKAREVNSDRHLENLLMFVAALNPIIGHDNAAKVAKYAHNKNQTLKNTFIELGLLTAEQFDEAVKPEQMVYPKL